MIRSVGIDLSLTGTGIADNWGLCAVVGRKGITTMTLDQRIDTLDVLTEDVCIWVGHPSLAVIELPAYSKFGAGSVERHALWWLVVRKLRMRGVPVAEVTGTGRLVYALGKGVGSKSAVVEAVTRRWPQFETDGNDNAADAVVLAAMGADHLGEPLTEMPKTHRRALVAVAWPELADAPVAP